MVSLIPEGVRSVLEPTPGKGNIVKLLDRYEVTAADNFFTTDRSVKYDCVVMNPPFSSRFAFGVPENFPKGMRLGYHILTTCMGMSDNIIALMPYFTISDSDVRLRFLKSFGMISVTALPRKTFEYARIQTVVLQLRNGYKGPTEFKLFERLTDNRVRLF